MGWASGSEIASKLWNMVREHIPDSDRKKVAKKFIRVFQRYDCDTMREAIVLWKDAWSKKND